MKVQWDGLKKRADEKEGFSFTAPAGEAIPTRVGWKDRLGESVLSGGLPTLLLFLSLLGWMGSGASSLVAVVAAAPLLVWFCRPLLTRNGVAAFPQTIAMLPLLILLAAGAMLLPTVGRYQAKGDPLHAEILAVVFQDNLESVLSWPAFLWVLGLLGGLWLWVRRVGSSSPWLQPGNTSRASLVWRVTLLVLLSAAAVVLHGRASLSDREQAWLSEQESFYQTRPFRNLPAQSQDDFWRSRVEALVQGRSIEVPSLAEHAPTSLEEVEAAEACFSRTIMDESVAPYPRSRALLDRVKLHLRLRPNGNRAFLHRNLEELVRLVGQSELSVEQLEEIRVRVDELEDEFFERTRELDQEAYRHLWVEGTKLESDRTIGWHSSEEILSWQEEKKIDWSYNGVSRPTPLQVFGYSLDWSPTIWLERFQRAELTREWVRVRKEIAHLSLPEQLAALGARRDAPGLLDDRSHRFWDSQLREDQVSLERSLVQNVRAALQARLQEKVGR